MSRILTIKDNDGDQLNVMESTDTDGGHAPLIINIPSLSRAVVLTRADVDALRAALAPYGSAKELSGPPTPHAGALDMSGVDPRRLAALSEAVRLASDSPDLTSIQAARFLLGEDGASDG